MSNRETTTTRIPIRETEDSFITSPLSQSQPQPSASLRRGGGGGDIPARDGDEGILALEDAVLAEYERLLNNLNAMSAKLHEMSNNPTAGMLDEMRGLERKMGTVFTLLKASVYSIVLEQSVQ
jgi:DASH complex subunit DAD3